MTLICLESLAKNLKFDQANLWKRARMREIYQILQDEPVIISLPDNAAPEKYNVCSICRYRPKNKTGRWEEIYKDKELLECNLCGEEMSYPANYCPYCGASMRKEGLA